MNKQTAVDWLEKAYWDNKGTLSQKHFDQAKAMHKEESELLFECGRNFQLTGEGTFNKVYNENYGGQDE